MEIPSAKSRKRKSNNEIPSFLYAEKSSDPYIRWIVTEWQAVSEVKKSLFLTIYSKLDSDSFNRVNSVLLVDGIDIYLILYYTGCPAR